MGTGKAGNVVSSDLEQVQFNEPGGLAISGEGRWLYIADTNNHAIKKYDFREKRLSEVSLQCATRIVFIPNFLCWYTITVFKIRTTVLKVGTVCHAWHLWKLLRSCKQFLSQ